MKKMLIFSGILLVLFAAIALVNKAEKTTNGTTNNQLSTEELEKQKTYYKNPISVEELQKQLANKQNATVYFYQTTCTHCMKVSPIVVPMAEELGLDLKVLDLQVYEAGWDAFKIEGTPTIIHYKEGKEISRIVGEQPKEEFKKWFESNK